MDATRGNGSMIEAALSIGFESMALLVVVPKQILTAHGMTEGEQNVLVADRDEARAGTGVTRGERIPFQKSTVNDPVH